MGNTPLNSKTLGLMRARRNQSSPARIDMGFDKLGLGVLLYAYAILLGACYLFAFWRPIGFNVFPYMGLQDYISAPLNRVAVLVAPPLILAAAFLGRYRMKESWLGPYAATYLVFLYSVAFLQQFYQAVSRYQAVSFHFQNEPSVLAIAALLFFAGAGLAIYSYRAVAGLRGQIAALILVQCAVSMAAGYSDGKTVYNGAEQVYFLENKELCESGGVRDWVLLGAFGSQTFFMNSIDKRLCLTDQKNLRLISRKVKEGL